MVSERRHKRIESEILKVIGVSLEYIKDPKLKLITITDVELSDDLRIATILFVSHKKKDDIVKNLEKAKGFFRGKIGKALNLRYTPDLKFEYDKGTEYQSSMENLFKQIQNDEPLKEDS